MTFNQWSFRPVIENKYRQSLHNLLVIKFLSAYKKRLLKKAYTKDAILKSLMAMVQSMGGIDPKKVSGYNVGKSFNQNGLMGAFQDRSVKGVIGKGTRALDDLSDEMYSMGLMGKIPEEYSGPADYLIDLLKEERKESHKKVIKALTIEEGNSIKEAVTNLYEEGHSDEEISRFFSKGHSNNEKEIIARVLSDLHRESEYNLDSGIDEDDSFFSEESDDTDDNPIIDFLNHLNSFCNSSYFKEEINNMASRMITGLAVDNAKTWREAASQSMRGRQIYEALQNEMQGPIGAAMHNMAIENARLISTFADDLQYKVAKFIREETLKGRRAASIASDLIDQYPGFTKARINLIARTETSKASTELTRARAEQYGLSWYIWRASHDQRTRFSHRLMDKVLCNWNDPPNPEELNHEKKPYSNYAPGETFQCRCYPAPVINPTWLTWPAKVYYGGRIQYMTLAEFKRIAGMEELQRAA
jgi:SPP1 gp7 family putative phage head morphogenesis protein